MHILAAQACVTILKILMAKFFAKDESQLKISEGEVYGALGTKISEYLRGKFLHQIIGLNHKCLSDNMQRQ